MAWDLQAVTGPRPTGLGVSVNLLLRAAQDYAPDIEVIGLRPNDSDRPLIGVLDRLKWEQWRLPARLRKEHDRSAIDLLYSPALGAPLGSPAPVIAHVHDLIQLRFPQQFSGVAGWYWKHLLPYTWQKCDALTVSNSSVAAEIEALMGYPRSRIHVVPYYPEPEFHTLALEQSPNFEVCLDSETPGPLFFTLGSHEARKNIELAIQGYAQFAKQCASMQPLLCYGLHTSYTPRLVQLARELLPETDVDDMYQYVKFKQYPERSEIVATMLKATALLFLSRYEGFGMPPLEAMSVGCAVVLSDIPAHRAVYDEVSRWDLLPADCRVRPRFLAVDDLAGLVEEMDRLASDSSYRASLRRSGLAYSRTFTPQATAAALVAAFNSVASDGH